MREIVFKNLAFWSLMLTLMGGCAHYPSGQYIQLHKRTTYRALSIRFGIPVWKIKDANGSSSLYSGKWVFVPSKKGIMPHFSKKTPFDKNFLPQFIQSQGFLWPVPSNKKVSSYFGKRWGKKHEGIDIPARQGASIVAVSDGIIVYSGKGLRGYGNLTVVSHYNGLYSVYAHAQRNLTHKGQRVSRGEVIAFVGQTGKATGPHLHFEMRSAGEAVNPLLVYKKFSRNR